ncbi:hypothetical protein CYMTET_29841 [Cymbomonas tetramitiformis]|uniref:Conserved oligomeric Golgi complex subunit 7 n=1 Tax=Cymbomonas tetramitiformis TaxID=36881 RepID=A0AAE0KUI0_9CHLO|nr:hypothetical protein CYMTET_29841 [Cymbomonas tetramitiformis]
MSVVDLTSFSDKAFNAKDWLNNACSVLPPEDSMEKYLAELEMKLQLLAEDISMSLEDQSTQAMQRIPRAISEISRVKEDGTKLQSSVVSIVQTLSDSEKTSAKSVHLLSSVDVVKRRMESARDTLKEAAGLAELMESVEEVFAGKDLKLMANTLARMRRGLQVVGAVPEFKHGRDRVAALEERLENVVAPALNEALTSHNSDKARELRNILVAIGRYSAVERQYVSCRVTPLIALWEQYDGAGMGNSASFVEWLPSFYDAILLQLDQEVRWSGTVFPEHHAQLLVQLEITLLEKTNDTYKARLRDGIAEAQAAAVSVGDGNVALAAAEASGGALGALLGAHNSTAFFARSLREMLLAVSTPGRDVQRILTLAYSPFEEHKQKYGDLERRQLAAEVASYDLTPGSDLDEVVHRMTAAVSGIASILEVAVERCLTFTCGTEVEALLRALDDVALQFITSLTALLRSVRGLCKLEEEEASTRQSSQAESEDGITTTSSGLQDATEHVQGALQLLAVSSALLAQLGMFEATLRDTLVQLDKRIGELLPLVETAEGEGILVAEVSGMEAAYVRLASTPDKARRLLSLLEQTRDARFHALPRATPRATSFQDQVHSLVYDVLISKVRVHLHELASHPEWAEAAANGSAFELPSFAAYPKENVTAVGEYLLTLPQQLEVLSGNSGGDGREGEEAAEDLAFFASTWLTKVTTGTAEAYLEELLRIPHLSQKGAQQAAADLEYLCNVYAALGEMVPPPLATFMRCSMVTVADFTKLVQAEASELDAKVVSAVAAMRGIELEASE